MGNSCCRGEASSSSSSMVFPHFHSGEKESLLDNKTSSQASSDNSSANHDYDKQNREVKIKITKEKLEELLGKADVHGMSVDQVLARLLSASADHHYYDHHLDLDSHHHHHHRSWRPALQTIPEAI